MNNVKKFRELKQMSRYRLEQLTGISYESLSRIERGCDVKLSTLSKIATALDVSIKELVSEVSP